MLDTKAAYGTETPRSHGNLRSVVVAFGEDLQEMFVFGEWWEGKRRRYNLVCFTHGTVQRVLRGYPDHLVLDSQG